jgi:hypothetical protein
LVDSHRGDADQGLGEQQQQDRGDPVGPGVVVVGQAASDPGQPLVLGQQRLVLGLPVRDRDRRGEVVVGAPDEEGADPRLA